MNYENKFPLPDDFFSIANALSNFCEGELHSILFENGVITIRRIFSRIVVKDGRTIREMKPSIITNTCEVDKLTKFEFKYNSMLAKILVYFNLIMLCF
jgi:hypothetical protein